ncbi:MAG: tRNA (adenosine(37)-N6)-threonylcarbamoyltransferase complex dimerization subunit type 1 TsaB, partial [Oribacterium parvum]|nr:tRNA (adenosine(37)-N6)-threonylcarbamoyltransferase complex dimerization subunit type 1 TsaB [Oribacterium parvum]
PNPQNALQRAASLALLGERKKAEGLEAGFHLEYLRKPQAEREKEAGALKDFQIVQEEAYKDLGKTKDKLIAKNYPIHE